MNHYFRLTGNIKSVASILLKNKIEFKFSMMPESIEFILSQYDKLPEELAVFMELGRVKVHTSFDTHHCCLISFYK
jgi:hypothetical protein